ncbi:MULTISPECIES: helix-turn-helix transcriptional regulator [unclassified Streptomyces]|uniref:helix-turn-helix transcriptional regulator n=1 Tax=unclassified Streptomyces TaxID=2593676 RepID=UPI002E2A76C0|nr:helix-turn-helix transcriptional regulator [Streptomyces sp. NBC_00223]
MRFAELGSFLAARRAEVTPQQVGLPGGGSRRLSGLRREEVAMLAGIGASWYTWIEQGRAKNVSPEILTAIAGVLDLDDAQRLYVMRLAGYAAQCGPSLPLEDDLRLGSRIVEDYLPNPAYFLDRYWDIAAANSTAVRLLGLGGARPNYLRALFGQPDAADRFPYWRQEAADAVARFRATTGEFLEDRRLQALIGELRDLSAVFAQLWDQHHVSDGSSVGQVLCHPEVGRLSLTRVALDFAPRSGMQLVLLSPQSACAAEKLSRWAAASAECARPRRTARPACRTALVS